MLSVTRIYFEMKYIHTVDIPKKKVRETVSLTGTFMVIKQIDGTGTRTAIG